ncbi:MAG: hypothetical protein ACI4TU_08410 [Candidatus Cryptobacteroides sp.]
MAYSIFHLIGDNQFVEAWLYRKALSGKLRSAKAMAVSKIESESEPDMTIDMELQKYCNSLTCVNEDLKLIQSLRNDERNLKNEIETARLKLQKAKQTRKILISMAAIAVAAICLTVAVLSIVKHSTEEESAEETIIVENINE